MICNRIQARSCTMQKKKLEVATKKLNEINATNNLSAVPNGNNNLNTNSDGEQEIEDINLSIFVSRFSTSTKCED